MALEIVGELLEGAARLLGRILVEVVVELLIRGVGLLLCRPFKPGIDPDGVAVAVVGIAFWLAVVGRTYLASS